MLGVDEIRWLLLAFRARMTSQPASGRATWIICRARDGGTPATLHENSYAQPRPSFQHGIITCRVSPTEQSQDAESGSQHLNLGFHRSWAGQQLVHPHNDLIRHECGLSVETKNKMPHEKGVEPTNGDRSQTRTSIDNGKASQNNLLVREHLTDEDTASAVWGRVLARCHVHKSSCIHTGLLRSSCPRTTAESGRIDHVPTR